MFAPLEDPKSLSFPAHKLGNVSIVARPFYGVFIPRGLVHHQRVYIISQLRSFFNSL